MRVLVTGASGFVGQAILKAILENSVDAVGALRRESVIPSHLPSCFIDPDSPAEVVEKFDVVIHAAGVAHLRISPDNQILSEQGNVQFTQNLVTAVNESSAGALLHITSIAACEAESPFGKSKREAEKYVEELRTVEKLGVNLRPPLIYGPGAKGNLEKLVRLSKCPLILLFSSVKNSRSYLGIDDLCSAVACFLECYEHHEKSGTFEIADESQVSLRDVVSVIRAGINRDPGLIPFPVGLMDRFMRLVGRSEMADGLFGDLAIDSSEFANTFEWTPNPATLASMADSVRNLTKI